MSPEYLLTSPVALFAAVLAIILIAPLVAVRAGIPAAVGIMLMAALAGAPIGGSHGPRLLARGPEIQLLGMIGLLFLMFLAGLTLDLRQFLRLKYRSLAFGLLSFWLPGLLGLLVGGLVLGFGGSGMWMLAAILGTHTLVAYPVALRLGLASNKAVLAVVGGTLITDAFGLLILAGVVAAASGDVTTLFWVRFGVSFGIFVAAVLVGVPWLSRWFFRTFPNNEAADLIFSMAVLFGSALGAQAIGVAPIIGAFLAGLSMNRVVSQTGVLMNRLVFVGEALFIPFFLVSVGLLLDFGVLFSSLSVWWVALVMTAALMLGKFVAALASQWAFGHRRDEAWVMFALSVPQAAGTLAVALVGFQDLGVFDQAFINATVIMILATCMVGPFLVERIGPSIVARGEDQPAPAAADGRPTRVLVPLANPEKAPGLIELALAMRGRDLANSVHALTVVPDSGEVGEEVARSERLLMHAVRAGAAAGVPITPMTRVDTSFIDGLLRAARDIRASAVVVGWKGEARRRDRIFGTVLDQLLDASPLQVIVARLEDRLATTRRLLLLLPARVPLMPGFGEALDTARHLAGQLRAELRLVGAPEDLAAASARLRSGGKAARPTAVALADWSHLPKDLGQHVQSGDLIVLMSAREKGFAWQRRFRVLPRQLAEAFPSHNFLTLYPALPVRPADQIEQGATGPELPLASMTHVVVPIEGIEEGDAAVRQTLDTVLGARLERGDLEALANDLLDSAVPLGPGMLLLHGVHESERTPRLIWALAEPQPVSFDGEPVNVLLVLVNPTDYPREDHLANLAGLARLLSEARFADGLVQVRDLAALEKRLSDYARRRNEATPPSSEANATPA